MAMDFNNEDRQSSGFDLIPKGTVVPFVINIRPGGEGPDGMLTQSRTSDVKYLSCEFTIESGPYFKRKIWQNIMVSGGKDNGSMGRAQLRAILESARNIKPDDQSENAKSARRINSFGDLGGLTVWGKVGIEKGSDGYEDKNKIATFLTPDMKDYGKATEKPQSSSPTTTAWQPQQQPAVQQQAWTPPPSENVATGPAPDWAQ